MKTTTNRWAIKIKRLAGESHYRGRVLAWYEHRNSRVDAADLTTFQGAEMRWNLEEGPSAGTAQPAFDLFVRTLPVAA